MKKTYVKPVMESEEFVANEYVAACWDLKCDTIGCEYDKYAVRIGGNQYSNTADDFARCVQDLGDSKKIHAANSLNSCKNGLTSILGGETSGEYYHIGGFQTDFALHHKLTITLVSEKTDNVHPNASA